MSTTLMATNLCTVSPFPITKSTNCSPSNPSILCSKISYFGTFSSCNGLRHMGVSISRKPFTMEMKTRCKGKVVYASVFTVGASESLVVVVAALLVIGPKGLAKVASNFGKAIGTFQSLIRELQVVSREFKSIIEKEIGLKDMLVTSQKAYRSNMTKATTTPSSTTKTDGFGAKIDFMHASSDHGIKSLVPPLLAALIVLSPIINTPVGKAIEVQRGAALFNRACIGCHDAGGNIIQPGATLFLKDLIRNGVDTEEEIYRVTYNGKERMPGFGESCTPRGQCTFGPRLKEEDIKLLAEFVKLQADRGWPNIETYRD